MSTKSYKKKLRLAKATRQTRKLPSFVIMRTKAKVSHNRRTRSWRYDKLAIEN
jgi:ribosomal protein L39E